MIFLFTFDVSSESYILTGLALALTPATGGASAAGVVGVCGPLSMVGGFLDKDAKDPLQESTERIVDAIMHSTREMKAAIKGLEETYARTEVQKFVDAMDKADNELTDARFGHKVQDSDLFMKIDANSFPNYLDLLVKSGESLLARRAHVARFIRTRAIIFALKCASANGEAEVESHAVRFKEDMDGIQKKVKAAQETGG